MSGERLPVGGDIDRTSRLHFTFEGRAYEGHAGDTLASALLANGVTVVGRSFKYHRPRGLLAAGVEEPNALVQVGEGARKEVNLRATEVELYDGLVAKAVNCWPNVRFDIGALSGMLGRFIPAGFYYKTLMWPNWRWFEGSIRRAAGLGRPSAQPDPDRYESRFAHCDVLIVGSGPAGLAAAAAASRPGVRVMLCEQEPVLGGSLLMDACDIDDTSGRQWVNRVTAALKGRPDTIIKTRTTAVGYFDDNALVLLERKVDHSGRDLYPPFPRQCLWQVRAKHVLIATGALERPLVFPNNDRPGVMLASAVRQYLGRFAVRAGRQCVVFTNNDDAYATAYVLLECGGEVAAIVDSRANPPPQVTALARARGIKILRKAVVVATSGRPMLSDVQVRLADGNIVKYHVDLLAMSGGFNPTTHLFNQSGGTLRWDEELALFKPGISRQSEMSIGAAAGIFSLEAVVSGGHESGARAAGVVGGRVSPTPAPLVRSTYAQPWTITPIWRVAAPGRAFVDFQNDVTSDDISLAVRENFVSVEHLKRYTTLGMAPDQGKTSSVNAMALLGELTGRAPAQIGTTRDRFPYTPLAFGALGGRSRAELFRPMRRMPCHDWHACNRAAFQEYAGWQRPAYYLRAGENPLTAEWREALSVRRSAGLFDGSPLGKIEVKGPDAAEFLDRVYANSMSTLKIGRVRYGLMLNELGVVIDDGVAARLGTDHFWLSTSSAASGRIAVWLDEWLQCEWTDLRVVTAPVTTAWAVLTLSGPAARSILLEAGVDFSVAAADFPHMSIRDGHVAGIPVRIMRVSFTGELTFEINVSAVVATTLWERLLCSGGDYGMAVVGIDAWMLLRLEKGYLHIGTDTDGTTAPADIGWGHVLERKQDFIGCRSLLRATNLRKDRLQFVGFEPIEPKPLPVGSHVLRRSASAPSDGYITSSAFSPTLGRWVAIGMLCAGRFRHGEVVTMRTGRDDVKAIVVTPVVYDPKGERLNA